MIPLVVIISGQRWSRTTYGLDSVVDSTENCNESLERKKADAEKTLAPFSAQRLETEFESHVSNHSSYRTIIHIDLATT